MDVEEETKRTLEEIRRRGRWALSTSVQRYSKDFLPVKVRSRIQVDLLKRGEFLVENPSVLVKAILQNKAKCRCCRRRRRAGTGLAAGVVGR